MPRKNQSQIREEVTQMFVKAITESTPPWRQPWAKGGNSGMPRNFHSKRRYTGINPLLLMWSAMNNGYTSCQWGTYASWQKHTGAHVRKGEKSTSVVLYKFLDRRDKSGAVITDGNDRPIKFGMMTQFHVFNVEQVQSPEVEVLLDGRCKAGKFGSMVRSLLDPNNKKARTKKTTVAELNQLVSRFVPKKMVPDGKLTRDQLAHLIHDGIEAKLDQYRVKLEERNDDPDFGPAEDFINSVGADVRHGGQKAFYRPSEDFIQMPPKSAFDSISHYYETCFHEHVHWTENKDRVGQKEGHKYAFGELVAEIGACFLMMELGVPLAAEMTEHSKGYIKSWLQGMTNGDTTEKGTALAPKFIFDASTQAAKAVDYLLSHVGKENPAYDESVEVPQRAA